MFGHLASRRESSPEPSVFNAHFSPPPPSGRPDATPKSEPGWAKVGPSLRAASFPVLTFLSVNPERGRAQRRPYRVLYCGGRAQRRHRFLYARKSLVIPPPSCARKRRRRYRSAGAVQKNRVRLPAAALSANRRRARSDAPYRVADGVWSAGTFHRFGEATGRRRVEEGDGMAGVVALVRARVGRAWRGGWGSLTATSPC